MVRAEDEMVGASKFGTAGHRTQPAIGILLSDTLRHRWEIFWVHPSSVALQNGRYFSIVELDVVGSASIVGRVCDKVSPRVSWISGSVAYLSALPQTLRKVGGREIYFVASCLRRRHARSSNEFDSCKVSEVVEKRMNDKVWCIYLQSARGTTAWRMPGRLPHRRKSGDGSWEWPSPANQHSRRPPTVCVGILLGPK